MILILVASNSSHGYKFAVMTPSLDKFNSTTFGFKLNVIHNIYLRMFTQVIG